VRTEAAHIAGLVTGIARCQVLSESGQYRRRESLGAIGQGQFHILKMFWQPR